MAATNQERLLSCVQANASGLPLVEEFLHFHLSVRQKLWSVEYFYALISKLQSEKLYYGEPISPPLWTDTITTPDKLHERTQGSTLFLEQPDDKEGLGFYVNLILDGFLMSSMSVLDTLAHEIKILYKFSHIPQKFYIHTIKDCMSKEHPHSFLTRYLSTELTKPWFKTLAMYRTCTTHESLIGFNVQLDTSFFTQNIQQARVPLPDNPRSKPFTYRRNREMNSYCVKTRRNVTHLVRHSHYCIIQDIRVAQNILPIS